MPPTMLLGQDVQVRMSMKSTGRLASLTAIHNFMFKPNLEIIREKLLGETNDRLDEVYTHTNGSFVVKPEDPEIFTFQQLIVQRAVNRSSNGDVAVLSWKYRFPNGKTAIFTVNDPKFSDLSVNSTTRDAHVEMPVAWEAEKYQFNV